MDFHFIASNHQSDLSPVYFILLYFLGRTFRIVPTKNENNNYNPRALKSACNYRHGEIDQQELCELSIQFPLAGLFIIFAIGFHFGFGLFSPVFSFFFGCILVVTARPLLLGFSSGLFYPAYGNCLAPKSGYPRKCLPFSS